MIIHPVMSFKSLPSIGMFSGNAGSNMHTHEINQYLARTGGGTAFAQNSSRDMMDHLNLFYAQVLEPQRQATQDFMMMIGTSLISDIKYITSVEDLEGGIPPAMQMAILTQPDIREKFEAGLIYGFGILPEELPHEDVWGRLINNGRVDLSEPCPEEGRVMKWEFWLDDPEWCYDDLVAVRKSRDWLTSFMDQTGFDVTNYPNRVGKLKG